MTLELRFTIPGQIERSVPLDQAHIKIGTLLSNQVALRAPGVDPIHALIEEREDGVGFVVTDLGSSAGVKLNGKLIEVEAQIKEGDTLAIGSVAIKVARSIALPVLNAPPPVPQQESAAQAEMKLASGEPRRAAVPTVKVSESEQQIRRQPAQTAPNAEMIKAKGGEERKKDLLFSPRRARPSGDVLEVVAYWGDTILDVELFHPSYKGFNKVTIGDPTKAHLIAAGKSHFDSFTLASIGSSGYSVRLRDGMKARLRKGGKVEKIQGDASVNLGSRDIAHIKYGPVSYFMMFVRPPSLDLPKMGPKDPFFLALMLLSLLLYLVIVPVAWLHHPSPEKKDKDDIWSIVQVPEKDRPPEKKEEKKEKPPETPPVKVAEKKTPPPKTEPPKPLPKPIQPAKAVEKEKVKQPNPVEKPVEAPKPTTVMTENKNKPAPNPTPTPQKPAEKDSKAPGPLSKLQGVGMPSTGANKPDFKLAGPSIPNTAQGKSGGVVGSGMNQQGGARKGTNKADYMGVEGVNNDKASGVNLDKLGLGVGKIMSKTGPGAVSTNFKNSAGGAGGGMGSASKTYGLGGVGSGQSLGLAGSGGAVNNFGSGSGGLLSGQGGSGGYGGAGLGNAFGGGQGGQGGHGRANVSVPAGDPVVSGGLTSQEIMAVIRANLNQIRHCYEQLLQRSPSSSGKMAVTFVVGLNGRVTSVNVTQSNISDARMRGCVTGNIQRWAFPQPRGGQPVTVNYPFVFNPL